MTQGAGAAALQSLSRVQRRGGPRSNGRVGECSNSICLDPETVRYLDYDYDRACSARTGSYATRD